MANTEIVGVRYSELPKTLSPTQDDLIATLDNESNILKATPLYNAVNCTLGDHDISEIADGTVKGAITELNERSVVTALELTYQEYLANKAYYDSLDSFIVIIDESVVVMRADQVKYDNTGSGLESTLVQGAIDEVALDVNVIDSGITRAKVTSFETDGSILDTFSPTESLRTIFNADGTISEIYTSGDTTIEHKTIFNADGTISVVDIPH